MWLSGKKKWDSWRKALMRAFFLMGEATAEGRLDKLFAR